MLQLHLRIHQSHQLAMSSREPFVLSKLPELDLQPKQYIVVGSGVLDALGIRKANDIDIVVTPQTYNLLDKMGWEPAKDSPSLIKDDFEAYLVWDSGDGEPNFEDLMSDHQVIGGFNFVKLSRLLNWKKRVGRPKDSNDVKLIEKYLNNWSLIIY